MLSLQNICVKLIVGTITTNRRDSSCLIQYIGTRIYSSILEQIDTHLKIRKRNKNTRLRRSEKRLTARYNRKQRARYYYLYDRDIDLVNSNW